MSVETAISFNDCFSGLKSQYHQNYAQPIRNSLNQSENSSPKTAGYNKKKKDLCQILTKTLINNNSMSNREVLFIKNEENSNKETTISVDHYLSSPYAASKSPKSSSPYKAKRKLKRFDDFFYERCKRYLNSCNLYIIDLEETDIRNKPQTHSIISRTKSCDNDITKSLKHNPISQEINESSLFKRRVSLQCISIKNIPSGKTDKKFAIKPIKCDNFEIIEEISTPSYISKDNLNRINNEDKINFMHSSSPDNVSHTLRK